MVVLLRALRALLPLLRLRRWMVAVIIILGVLTALSEGLSISLLVPFIQNQMGTADAGVIGRRTALFQGIPAERRLWWIGVSILMLLVLKNIVSYSCSLLFQWVKSSITHGLRCGIF